MGSDRITLRGMHFFARHGVLPHERRRGNEFLVDLELFTDTREAARLDNLEATVDYAAVYGMVREILEGESRLLLEALAENIAEGVLEQFAVDRVVVTVSKLKPPVGGQVQAAEVTIERER